MTTMHAAIGAMGGGREFDFYRCQRCQGLLTKPQIDAALTSAHGRLCACGGVKIAPTNPKMLELFLPRVLAFAWQRLGELGWRGVLENARADAVRRLIAGGTQRFYTTVVPSNGDNSALIAARSEGMARVLAEYVYQPTPELEPKPIAVGMRFDQMLAAIASDAETKAPS